MMRIQEMVEELEELSNTYDDKDLEEKGQNK